MNKTKCVRPCKKKVKKRTMLFSKQGRIGRFFDDLMRPLRLWLQGNSVEEPQRTHFWNWTRIDKGVARFILQKEQMVPIAADPKACKKSWFPIPRFHMPRFGGWSQYVVLTPGRCARGWIPGEVWYIGWVDANDNCFVSRVPLTTSVRMLRGPEKTKFFALNHHHQQISLFSNLRFGETGKAPPEHAVLPQL